MTFFEIYGLSAPVFVVLLGFIALAAEYDFRRWKAEDEEQNGCHQEHCVICSSDL